MTADHTGAAVAIEGGIHSDFPIPLSQATHRQPAIATVRRCNSETKNETAASADLVRPRVCGEVIRSLGRCAEHDWRLDQANRRITPLTTATAEKKIADTLVPIGSAAGRGRRCRSPGTRERTGWFAMYDDACSTIGQSRRPTRPKRSMPTMDG